MLKVALVAATLVAAVSAGMATNVGVTPDLAPASEAACRSSQSMDLACAARAADVDGDGLISATELASLAVPAQSVVDWMPLRPSHRTGLEFKDAANDPAPLLPAVSEGDRSQPLIPALFALGALVILLRRRPT